MHSLISNYVYNAFVFCRHLSELFTMKSNSKRIPRTVTVAITLPNESIQCAPSSKSSATIKSQSKKPNRISNSWRSRKLRRLSAPVPLSQTTSSPLFSNLNPSISARVKHHFPKPICKVTSIRCTRPIACIASIKVPQRDWEVMANACRSEFHPRNVNRKQPRR